VSELARLERVRHCFSSGAFGLRDVSLSISQGDLLVLAGRNGSGKTLLVRHLVGLARPTEGRVLYRGQPIERDLRAVRSSIGLVFQDAEAQIIGRTVAEDVAFGPSNLRLPAAEIRARVEAALAACGLGAFSARAPESLSGGERRRLAIAGVLAMRPECLVLDEPFSNLDFPAIQQTLATMLSLHAAGTTLVVLTHELEKVLAHATRLAVLDAGALVYDGPADGLPPERFLEHGLMNPYRHGAVRSELSWL
jgi:energy-coupling factor transporter ATP-binding protein EcfA2